MMFLSGKNVPAVHVSHRTLTLKRERNAFLGSCKLMVGSMASSSSILTSPEQKNSPSIDAVLGNDDLITEILLLVPPKAVLRFKLVSKKWFSIISKTSFATRHTLLNSHTVSALLLRVSLFFKELPTNKYVSLDVDGRSLAYFPHDFLDFDPTNNPGCIHNSQSCNGLLLCSKCSWDRPERFQPINYIFNPTTRQFGMLPPPPPDNGLYFDSIRLVFDPSESSCYRVVCTQFFTSELKIYVYSSETKDWKLCVSQENFDFLPLNFTDGVSWNDAVHWISPMGNGFSFVLDKDCLQTITRPPLPENWQDQNLRYLERGCSKWFAKYCLRMNAIAYPEITEDADVTEDPIASAFLEDKGPLLVMNIHVEIIPHSFKDRRTFMKILSSLPLQLQ
uniref:F-box domain-containing protein n=1 Tax=Salix viminalis TaxID=40686 RepID=A0A6N2LJT4_SALVM